MILNEASVASVTWSDALRDIPGIVAGMSTLVSEKVSTGVLRMARYPHEERWKNGRSLNSAFRATGRDEFNFFAKLSSKVPLLVDVSEHVKDRFRGCEATALSQSHGEPLLLCAITGAISVGFPSQSVWDTDQLGVDFEELLPDDSFEETHERIDNLTRLEHAGPIVDRHRAQLRDQCRHPADLWNDRERLFPHLEFGPDVEGQLGRVNPGWLSTLVGRLADLDSSAVAWRKTGGAVPSWTTKVTQESDRVMDNRKLREARRFMAVDGLRRIFEWHARFGSGSRIHLRFEAATHRIEIGYIGKHLPL